MEGSVMSHTKISRRRIGAVLLSLLFVMLSGRGMPANCVRPLSGLVNCWPGQVGQAFLLSGARGG